MKFDTTTFLAVLAALIVFKIVDVMFLDAQLHKFESLVGDDDN